MKRRPRRNQPAAVNVRKCPEGHTPAHVKLVFRMDVVCFTDVDGDDETCFGGTQCCESLRLAHVTPGFISRLRLLIAIVRQLNNPKGKIAFAPTFTPRLDHGWQ